MAKVKSKAKKAKSSAKKSSSPKKIKKSSSKKNTSKAIVVETPKEEEIAASTPTSSLPKASQQLSDEPDAIDLMAKDLNKNILSYVRGITKSMLEDYLKKLPKGVPFYIIPRYGTNNTFTIDITDGAKKVTIPAQGHYSLVG